MASSGLVPKTLLILLCLNGLAMAAGAGWLVMLNAWQVAWPGVFGVMVSPVLLPLLMLPGTIFIGLMSQPQLVDPKHKGLLMAAGGACFTGAMAGYAMILFMLAGAALQGDTLWPTGIYLAGAAMLPWVMLAMKDKGNAFYFSMLLILQVSVIVTLYFGVTVKLPVDEAFLAMWGMMTSAVFLIMIVDNKAALKKSG